MNKWYHAFGLMLLVAMVCDLSGCAQTSGWLTKKSAKKSDDEKLADADKKSTDKNKAKTSKKPTAKELADAKSDKPKEKSKPDTAIAKTGDTKSKAVDAEHEKYAAAERAKRKKVADGATDAADKTALAANTTTDKPKKPAAKPESSKSDDDMDMLLTKNDTPASAAKKKPASDAADEDFLSAADDSASSKKKVVQVKKEISKNESDIPDWADGDPQPESKQVKSASLAENFEDQLESPFAAKANARARQSRKTAIDDLGDEPSNDDTVEFSPPAKKKPTAGKPARQSQQEQGFAAICPDANNELREVLKKMDAGDADSLRQGLHRIGQMGRDGQPAINVLRKMLKHEDAFVRAHAALALARLDLSSPESDIVVVGAIKSSDASLRSFGVSILDEMGPKATDVLENLAECMNDRNGQVRLRVAEILIRHEKWEQKALHTLLACLKDKDESVRWLTTYSLAELAPEDSPETVQALIKAAHDREPRVQAGAVYALGEIGRSAKRASEDLRKLKSSTTDEELKSAIDYALKQINQ